MLTIAGLLGLTSAFTATGFGAIKSYSAFFNVRLGDPSPALRSFSIMIGSSSARARASSTKSLSAFLGIRLMEVTPRELSSASTSLFRWTAFLASTIACTSFAVKSFFNSIFAGLTAALTGAAFFATAFFAGAAFFATAFFAGAAFFATAFLTTAFFATAFFAGAAFFATVFLVTLFLSALNTATIVLWFYQRCAEAMAIL